MSASKSTVSQFITVLLLCSQVTHVVSVEGRLFFLAFMNPTPLIDPNSGIEEIHISGFEETKVRVAVVSLNLTYMFQLNSTNQFRKSLMVYQDLAGPNGTRLPISVIVSSEKNISVQANKAEDGTSGGYLALPITTESTQYYVASYTPRGTGSGFSIGSPYHTCVTVYRHNGPDSVREMDITMNPGQVYHVTAADLTGYYVESMKPIALFSGLDCAYVPVDTSTVQKCDHIVEQLHPMGEYGSVFIISSIPGRKPDTGFQIRVMAKIRTIVAWTEAEFDPATNVLNAPVVKDTNLVVTRGNFLELSAGRGKSKPVVVMLTCSQPCEVMQYGQSNDMTPQGNEPQGVKPDSTMITVPALQHYTNDITFSTSKLYSASGNQTLENVNGITIIAKKSDLNNIMFDGAALPGALSNAKQMDATFLSALGTNGVSIPGDTFSIVYGSVSPGFHSVTVSDKSVLYMVLVYGHAPASSPSDSEGYAYLAGMRYGSPTNYPITEGPWFDFKQPVGDNPVVQEPPKKPTGPNAPVTPTEYPSYESIWELRFYILNPHLNDLKTRNCSEAYYRYYLEERFYPKQREVIQMVKDQCDASITVNMTHMLYYSQYTDGLIRFRLSVGGSGAVTLSEIMDCLRVVSDNLSDLKNWVPVDYKDETSFLRPDAYYNRGCDPLHTKTPNFESFYYGWQCPYLGGVFGATGKASVAQASLGLLLVLAAVTTVLVFLRR